MTMAMADTNANAPKGRAPRWQRWLGGAAVGLAFGYGAGAVMAFTLPEDNMLDRLSLSGGISLTLAAMAAAVGLILLIMSFSRRMYEAENWTPEMDASEHRQIAPQLRLTALSLGAMAVEFAALAVPASAGFAVPVVVVVALSMLVQAWTSYVIWKGGDELYRAVVVEGSAISLCLTLLILSIWVPLVLQGLVQSDPLMMLIFVTIACIVPTIWLTVKRGMTG
jgi:hypothetical protein